MATLSKTAMMGREKFYKSIFATTSDYWDRDDAYDSELHIPPYAEENWTLTLRLRIFYAQINPDKMMAPMMKVLARARGMALPGGDVGFHPDADKEAKWVKEWSVAEWNSFIQSVKVQAALWDNKFHLVPPNDLNIFNRDAYDSRAANMSAKFRPTIKCRFKLEIPPHPSAAHHTVQVANVYGPNFFRSHVRLYNSNDAVVRPTQKQDWRANVIRNNHPVIAHEIGHSLGLPHIGVTRGLAHCGLAANWEKFVHQDSLPWIYQGGTNADVCYGTKATAGDLDNIMGVGSTFTSENGRPWLDRFFKHLNLPTGEAVLATASRARWTVSVGPVAGAVKAA